MARQLNRDGAQVIVVADAEAVAREGAGRLVTALGRAIAKRGEAHLALTGGSSAMTLYRELVKAEWRNALAWEKVHLWWGDERFVPVDHPDSNIGLAYRILLAMPALAAETGATGGQGVDVTAGAVPGLPIHAENVHPFEVDEALSESDPGDLVAQRYAEALESTLPAGRDGLPAFDVVLLGVGADGHVLSVFPGSPALDSGAPLVVAVPVPEDARPRHPRVTLNPRLLPAAGTVIVMVNGADKAETLAQVLGEERNPHSWPAQLALLPNAVWLLDEAAAARLAV